MGETSESPKPITPTGKLIQSSGCVHIQDALADMAKHGFTADDLDAKTQDTVIGTMASAKSVGGEAAPVENNESE
jgi:hypothetical protein